MDRSAQRSHTELRRSHLVQGFLREGECGPEQAIELLEIMKEPGRLEEYEYNFNAYFVTFRFDVGTVRLQDELDDSPEGELSTSLDEFRALLQDYVQSA